MPTELLDRSGLLIGCDCHTCKPQQSLSHRERELVLIAASDLTHRGIALRLGVQEQTIKNSLSLIYPRFDVTSRTGLIIRLLKLGVLSVDEIPDDSR